MLEALGLLLGVTIGITVGGSIGWGAAVLLRNLNEAYRDGHRDSAYIDVLTASYEDDHIGIFYMAYKFGYAMRERRKAIIRRRNDTAS